MVYPYRKIIKPPLGSRLNKSHKLSRGLVGFWLMNEKAGSQVFDLSGNENTGIVEADITWGSGKYGSALNILGDDKIVIPYSSSLNWSSNDPLTIIVWGRTTAGDGAVFFAQWADIILRSKGGDGSQLDFYLVAMTGDDEATTTGESVNDGNWHMLTGSYDGMTIFASVDDHPRATAIPDGAYSNDLGAYGIGYEPGGVSINPGAISHVLAYNRCLSDSERILLYREPFCIFAKPGELAIMGGYKVPEVGNNVPVKMRTYRNFRVA